MPIRLPALRSHQREDRCRGRDVVRHPALDVAVNVKVTNPAVRGRVIATEHEPAKGHLGKGALAGVWGGGRGSD